MRIAVIGAGMAGLACASRLAQGGASPVVFEKSRGLGGRMATRRSGAGAFDHGAQFLTARGDRLSAYLAQAETAGAAARWSPAGRPETSETWWTGAPGMSRLARPLAEGLDIRQPVRVTGLAGRAGGWTLETESGEAIAGFDAVVLAIPAPQAVSLLEASGLDHDLHGVAMAPCWALMLAFDTAAACPVDMLRPEGGPIAFAAREASRPGREAAPERWVIHATPDWSRDQLEWDKAAVIGRLAPKACELIGATGEQIHADTHRWRYALVETPLGRDCLWDKKRAIGLAGDWMIGGRIEAAFDSGNALAAAILDGG